jgi:hypothetical protein
LKREARPGSDGERSVPGVEGAEKGAKDALGVDGLLVAIERGDEAKPPRFEVAVWVRRAEGRAGEATGRVDGVKKHDSHDGADARLRSVAGREQPVGLSKRFTICQLNALKRGGVEG